MKKAGFTLIELMIVVAIIAIVASISIPNLMRARMAANEASAVASCKTYATAQDVYRRTDYNHDGVLEYAQRLSGANSLYENVSGAGDISLIDRAFALAEGQPQSTAVPKGGYVYSVLTAQGSNAPGGSHSFVDGSGQMTLGYGLSCVANQYDGVGRNTYVLCSEGVVWMKDRGSSVTQHELTFDPDSLWLVAE